MVWHFVVHFEKLYVTREFSVRPFEVIRFFIAGAVYWIINSRHVFTSSFSCGETILDVQSFSIAFLAPVSAWSKSS
jgi:hypothetical protein